MGRKEYKEQSYYKKVNSFGKNVEKFTWCDVNFYFNF